MTFHAQPGSVAAAKQRAHERVMAQAQQDAAIQAVATTASSVQEVSLQHWSHGKRARTCLQIQQRVVRRGERLKWTNADKVRAFDYTCSLFGLREAPSGVQDTDPVIQECRMQFVLNSYLHGWTGLDCQAEPWYEATMPAAIELAQRLALTPRGGTQLATAS